MKMMQLSSLEKVFLDGKIKSDKDYTKATALKGEKFSYQIAFRSNGEEYPHYSKINFEINSPLKEYIKVYNVQSVPSQLPACNNCFRGADDDYITTSPGLFPDVLVPFEENSEIYSDVWSSVWIEITLPEDLNPGTYQIESTFSFEKEKETKIFTLEVLDYVLPDDGFKCTQWFYCDSLYTHYNIEPFSEKHWEIIENFAKTFAEYGNSMILTPLFTPTLDVDVGGERPTNQLLGIEKNKDKYTFDFTNLIRWIKMCDKVGIKYLEMPHFFTQWGATSAPKIMVTENGEYKKLFGWETSATSDEYKNFLNQIVPELLKFFKERNMKDRVYFHVSDEPGEKTFDTYKAARDILVPLLEDFKSMDALSRYEFYEKGLVQIPVVANNHIKPFLDKDIPELWAYYCCSQTVGVSNRFMSMPSHRNRIMGTQMYKFHIDGFLQWGYNFYYAARTRRKINPYITTDALNTFPSGDAFSVYPGENGECYPSLRLLVFNEGLQDMRALKALEAKIGYDNVVKLIEEDIDFEIEFDKYPKNADYILNLRDKVNKLLSE